MGCATSMVKYLLFFFNFLFVIGSAALITIGALMFKGYKTYEDFVDLGAYQAPPILMMVFGGVMFVIAFCGCCGAVKESKCMMTSYACLLLVLLIGEVAIAVGVGMYKDEFKSKLQEGMQKTLEDYDKKPEVKEAWDTIQQGLKCCGVNGSSDWLLSVPRSCDCAVGSEGCSLNIVNLITRQTGTYTAGCLDKAIADLKTDYVIYGASIIAAIELLGIIFGCCLAARFGRKTYTT